MPRDGGLSLYSAAIAQRNHKVSIDSRIVNDLAQPRQVAAHTFRGVVHVVMCDAQKRMKITHEDTKKTKKVQKKPSCSSFLRG
jgi:hypothetical protein